jgi:NAD-dependent SIR2 family protein deacetylase
MQDLDDLIIRAAELLRRARYAVAMTGAGVSTPSGIPDFRSPDSGLWTQVDPMAVASVFAFRLRPHDFYDWIRPLAQPLLEAQPNPAHEEPACSGRPSRRTLTDCTKRRVRNGCTRYTVTCVR